MMIFYFLFNYSLNKKIKQIDQFGPPFINNNFILSGGCHISSQSHVTLTDEDATDKCTITYNTSKNIQLDYIFKIEPNSYSGSLIWKFENNTLCLHFITKFLVFELNSCDKKIIKKQFLDKKIKLSIKLIKTIKIYLTCDNFHMFLF